MRKRELYTTIKMALKINAVDITASAEKISKLLYRLRCLCLFCHFVRLLSNKYIRVFLMITNVIMCALLRFILFSFYFFLDAVFLLAFTYFVHSGIFAFATNVAVGDGVFAEH